MWAAGRWLLAGRRMSGRTPIPASVQAIMPGPLNIIGRALQARLEAAFPLRLFQHDFVPAKLDAKAWGKLTSRTPFIGLGWNDVEPTRDASRLFDGFSAWSVFLVSKNNYSVGARYFGDAQGQQDAPGLFAMTQVAIAVLHGMKVPNVGSVSVVRASNAYGEGWDEAMATCVIDLSVSTTIPPIDAVTQPGDLGLFETLDTVWNLASPVGGLGGVDELHDVIAVPTPLEAN